MEKKSNYKNFVHLVGSYTYYIRRINVTLHKVVVLKMSFI